MQRREEVFSQANVTNPYLLSFIIDVMDSTNAQLPWKGRQDSFSNPSKQIVTGVKEHGFGMHVFPAVDTVRKEANLTIYIIDTVIERWMQRHGGRYPTKIYCQLDVGSENANRFVS
jgi:hypothetical protein